MSSLPALPPTPPSQSSFLVLPPSPPQTGESSLLHNPEVCSVLQSLVSQEGRGEVAPPSSRIGQAERGSASLSTAEDCMTERAETENENENSKIII